MEPITQRDLDPVWIMSRLRELATGSAGDPREAITAALDRAARPDLPEDERRRFDEAVLSVLDTHPARDAVLAEVRLDRLAELFERCTRALRETAWRALDAGCRSAVLRRLDGDGVRKWSELLLGLVEASDFTLGVLFRRRAERYGSKVLFEFTEGGRPRTLTWQQTAARVDQLSRGLLALDPPDDPARVALLCDNRVETALVDLACLSSGLIDVMVPANATEPEVGYILGHARAGTLVVSDPEQLRKALRCRDGLPDLRRIVTLDRLPRPEPGVIALEELLAGSERVAPARVRERSEAVRISDLATVMYTSGTTGMPKGIQFSHRNVVFKRFARALALPEIGEEDVFLCFLPLYHTFGRFLELWGTVFWGARYCFLESASVDSLLGGMRRHRPTAFISVPKKWIQLHEMIRQGADPDEASDAELVAATRRVTGGRLKWGLSAAGHLDPEVFRFFRAQGIELLSGFGMTEATGGITMTPLSDYRDGSLGRPLPGIETRLGDDGELLVRGPYVMMGYLDPPPGESSFDDEGWFHTGDLMEVDENGHFRLVDRKKEIYKNVKGQTIAPQRVENLFRDFESVGRAFLVGDHREYNTLLIHPNPSYAEPSFATLSAQEIKSHFRSLVVSVNKFLAPYERIVDLAVIDRDLDPERGELTPKGTPRRKVVERNFSEVIRRLYRRTDVQVGGMALTLPNWLFQILGLTAQDVQLDQDRIVLPSSGTALSVERVDADVARIGSCRYRHPGGAVNLGAVLTSPRLWLGNEELVRFVPLDTVTRQRPGRFDAGLEWAGRVAPYEPAAGEREALEAAAARPDPDLLDLDLAARMLAVPDETCAGPAVELLAALLAREEGPLTELARLVLARAAELAPAGARRRAFQVLLPVEKEPRAGELFRRFLVPDPTLLDAGARAALVEKNLSEAKVEVLIEFARLACTEPGLEQEALAGPLLELLAAYGAAHPVRYRRLRAFLERMSLFARAAPVRDLARRASSELLAGFRQWLGPPSRIAVDPETGHEYRWDEVVVFDDDVPGADRLRLLSAIATTAFLKEGVFLFSGGATIRLSDVPPGGIWCRLLGSRHGKSVYRITVQTRFQGSYDLAANVNNGLTPEQVREEIGWLILSGDPGNREPLVEDFGGYWPEQDLWSEEFISGETLDAALRRLSRPPDPQEHLRRLWPFQARATLSAYVDFWHRSGGRLELADPSMTNVVVPTEDYQSGVRIVSVSRRRPHAGLLAMLRSFRDELVTPAERSYPALEGLVDWSAIFSSVPEIVGEDQALALFRAALASEPAGPDDGLRAGLRDYLAELEARGFTPMRLHFASERYRRWAALSADATAQARALTLQELFDTYGLQRLAVAYPAIRVRFFRETVFRDCAPALAEGLDGLIRRVRNRELPLEELIDAGDELRARLELGPEEEYFLARLFYPYLRPEDSAGFVRSDQGGRRQSEIVVTLADHDGSAFRVRHALNPREVERLHRLFLAAKLDVRFRMEHQYLVALNERGQIIAGIYYEIDESGVAGHLEKIVVAERYRRKGVADGLMLEFFNRLRAAGVKTVTTGFFRPEYFYGFGFRIEKRYAGLVKSLAEKEKGDRSIS